MALIIALILFARGFKLTLIMLSKSTIRFEFGLVFVCSCVDSLNISPHVDDNFFYDELKHSLLLVGLGY